MAIADSKALLADIMDAVDEHVTAKASRELEKRLLDVLGGYEIATMIRDESGDADNSQKLIDAFINAKTAEGLAKSSLYLYRYRLVRLHDDTGIPIKKMTADHIKDYVAGEIDRGISKITIKEMERLIWQFFRWLRDEELIRQNPTKNIKIVKATYEQREAFSQTEVHLIKEACHTPRQKALIYFLLSTGCRKSEVISINRKDVDFKNLQVTVTGKGNKTRTVYFDDVTALMLKRYLKNRKDKNPALFTQNGAKRYSVGAITQVMIRLSKKTGIHVFAHRFRHTLAQTLLDRGMRIEEVQQILGHEKIDTTRRYCHANQRNAENSYRKYACM